MIKNFNIEKLLNWFDKNKKDFPWNDNKTPYRVWISEVMLQQTVAASVIPYFEKWFSDFPEIEDLAEAELSDVLRHWEGLGYYSRCRNLHKAAVYLKETYSGELPATYKELLSIPGIGDYTARAILSIAYKKPLAVLDANVRRIIQRLSATQKWSTKLEKETIVILESLIPIEHPGDFNVAMMQLGQQVCTARSPKCDICPFNTECIAYKTGIAETIPEKNVKKIKKAHKMVLLFCSDNKILLRKKKKGLFHDLWLIPTEEINSSKKIRAIREEWPQISTNILKKRSHFYTDNKDILTPVILTSDVINFTDITPEDNDLYLHEWVEVDELIKYPCPSVYRKILDEVKTIL